LRGFKVDVCSNFPPREGQREGQQIATASRLQPISAWAATKPGGVIFLRAVLRSPHINCRQLSPPGLRVAPEKQSWRNSRNICIREESIHQLISHMKAMKNTYGKIGALT
jgi:hypothetical protein